MIVCIIIALISVFLFCNESTAGADASVRGGAKAHNIKLLASFYTHIDYNYHDEFCCV